MLTRAALRVLKCLADDEECDLVADGTVVYCGDSRTNWQVLRQLLEHMAISITYGSNTGGMREKGATYFGINHTGRSILRRPELADEVWLHLMRRKGPFQIINDRIRRMPKS